MDETTRSIIEKITVRYAAPTKIPSGHECQVFYDCFQLSPNDLARLAAQTVGHLPDHSFDMVVGIAYSGVFFASAVAGGRQVAIIQKDEKLFGPSPQGKNILIVDDVVFKGNHLDRAERILTAAGGHVMGFACIIDRSAGAVGSKNRPLWSAFQTSME